MRTEERKLLDLLGNTLDHIYTKFQNSQENELNYKMIRGMFLHLITTHKLENKIDKIFTCSLNNYHIDSKELYTELENKKKKVRLIFDEQCKVLRKIASQFRLRGFKELPIVIKGGSIFGITNDHRSIKRSNDIDLIYSDVSIIEMILTEMGFERKGDDKLSEHEYCMMVKDNVVIDVHKYIPIINYSDGIIDKSKKAVANNSRIFFESFTKIKQEKLLYSEIANNSLLSDFFGLPIPRLNYQVLILSANIFRDYVNSCFHFSSGIILAELLDVIDLISHPEFNYDQLVSISSIERRTSISFVSYLISILFGDNRLEGFNVFNMLYPKFLFWNGTMYLPTQLNEFVYFDSSDFMNSLDSETVDLSNDDIKLITPDIKKYSSHGLKHVKIVTFEKNNNYLHIKITLINKPIATTADVFEISIDGKRCCVSFADNTLRIEESLECCEFTLMEDKDGYSVSMFISLRAIFSPWKKNAGIIVCVTRWGDGPLSTVIPVSVISP